MNTNNSNQNYSTIQYAILIWQVVMDYILLLNI